MVSAVRGVSERDPVKRVCESFLRQKPPLFPCTGRQEPVVSDFEGVGRLRKYITSLNICTGIESVAAAVQGSDKVSYRKHPSVLAWTIEMKNIIE
jgi:hypothetical protein